MIGFIKGEKTMNNRLIDFCEKVFPFEDMEDFCVAGASLETAQNKTIKGLPQTLCDSPLNNWQLFSGELISNSVMLYASLSICSPVLFSWRSTTSANRTARRAAVRRERPSDNGNTDTAAKMRYRSSARER